MSKTHSLFRIFSILLIIFLIAIKTLSVQYPDSSLKLQDKNSVKLKFDLLYEASKDTYDAWSGNVWGTVGFLIIVLGWLLTSKETRIFLSKNNFVRIGAIIVFAMIAIINMLVNLNLAQKSLEIQENLANNAYVQTIGLQSQHYGNYYVPFRDAIISDILVGILFGFIILFLSRLSKSQELIIKSV